MDDVLLFFCEKGVAGGSAVFDVYRGESLTPLLKALLPKRTSWPFDPRTLLELDQIKLRPGTRLREGSWYWLPLDFLRRFAVDLVPPSESLLVRARLKKGPQQALAFSGYLAPRPEGSIPDAIPGSGPAYDLHDPASLLVVDVGQGNWNELRTRARRLIYDVGADFHWNQAQVSALVERMAIARERRALDLVISHWDVDHIHALFGFTPRDVSRLTTATFPSPPPPTETYARAHRILRDGNVVLRGIPPASRPPGSGRRIVLVRQDEANGLTYYRATRGASRNMTGLVLLAAGLRNHGLLTGDHHYPQLLATLPGDTVKPVCLVAPHHGGRAGRLVLAQWARRRVRRAGVSFGAENPYGHPDAGVLQALETLGASVRTTAAEGDLEYAL